MGTTLEEKLLEQLMDIYTNTEVQVNKAVSKRLAKGITEQGWNENKLTSIQSFREEIQNVLANGSKASTNKAMEGILKSYLKGINEANTDLGKAITTMNRLFVPAHMQKLLMDANNVLKNSHVQVLRNVDDTYRKLQSEASSMVLSGAQTRLEATDNLLSKFADSGITKFIDKAGRNWNLGSYAEMAIRTNTSHASLQGKMDGYSALGMDLVKVSTIGLTCPICAKWQNVVLSISGKSEKYHSVETARSQGLFHPNCKHTLMMFDEELDGEGQVEPNDKEQTKASTDKYDLTQIQRSNERNIRYWKRREQLALTDESRANARAKVRHWQAKQLQFCELNGLDRKYYREGLRKAEIKAMKGPDVSDVIKKLEAKYSALSIDSPKKEFFKKFNLQFFAEKDANAAYIKYLKAEIKDLNDLSMDKKTQSLTNVYKKYIGDAPAVDFDSITQFQKGTKEYKNAYAKWLKEQVEDIGKGMQIQPDFVEKPIIVAAEDMSMSPTNLYKKYMLENPTDAFKAEFGYMDKTEYGKWLNLKAKDLKAGNIKKLEKFQPEGFDNVVLSNQKKAIAQAKTKTKNTIEDLTANPYKIDKSKLNSEMKAFADELDMDVTGNYSGSQKVKSAWQEYEGATDAIEEAIAKEKYELAKQKHLEVLYEQGLGFTDDKIDNLIETLEGKIDKVSSEAGEHVKAQIEALEKAKKSKKIKEKIVKEVTDKDEVIKKANAKKALETLNSEDDEEKIKRILSMGRLSDSEVKNVIKDGEERLDATRKEFGRLTKKDLTEDSYKERGQFYFDIHDYYGDEKTKAIKKMTPLQAIGDYTSGSCPHNFYGKKNESANDYFRGRSRYTREQAKQVNEKLDKAFDSKAATLPKDTVVRHGNKEQAIYSLLGSDDDFEDFTQSKLTKRLKELNEKGGKAIVNETGYLSTSVSKDSGFFKEVEIRILCPKGSKGIYVNPISCYDHEMEMILPRDTNFRFIKAYSRDLDVEEYNKIKGEIHGNPKTVIFLEVIP